MGVLNTTILETSIWEHLKEEAEQRFEFKINHHTPIKRGWLNEKWRIDTDQGSFLLKQYNRERLKKYDLETIETALRTQNKSYSLGIPCPQLLEYKGTLLQRAKSGEHFTVMRFMEGSLIHAGEVNPAQMETLGVAVGKFHRLANTTLQPKSTTKFQIPLLEERLRHWNSVLEDAAEKGLTHLFPFINEQLEATKKFVLPDSAFLQKGWCHRDLWVDNLLFYPDRLAAILDFDRLNYDYIALDMGRVIISTCLKEDFLNTDAVHAFVKGYRNTNELSIEQLVSSLELLWYMESTWWISVIMDHEGDPPKRFAKEMNWLAQNLGNLKTILFGKK